MQVEDFIGRWKASGASERANFQSFLNELCDLIGAPRPDPATETTAGDAYVFERPVKDTLSGTTKYIDLYKRGCFVLEAKQGSEQKTRVADPRQQELLTGESMPEGIRPGTAVRGTPGWAKAMAAARQQAWNYARALDIHEGWPPFLIVVDVGHVIELYSDFSGTGKNYTQFRDGRRFRIQLDDLRSEDVRETLRLIWTNPKALDPAHATARVTRKIADQLAALGKSFEEQGHESEKVARFLMRCLFSMFAEDVELIPKDSFTKLLTSLRGDIKSARPMLQALWEKMNTGGFSSELRADLLRFNGGLFADAEALPINETQLHLLINAAEADWKDVEPAIFGTLLERALSPKERHKLGAHYTPRAYVERLVTPTIVEPLRADWDAVKAAAFSLADKGDDKAARDEVKKFHRQLCDTRVLDPACGSGNFLYVALEQLKRLEGEVLDTLTELGEAQSRLQLTGETVDPHQFLGIELNPWAAAVAELVLWIGYLQWHFKTFGQATPSEPVLKDFHNIECRDALLEWADRVPKVDASGRSVTVWDRRTTVSHPYTGEQVPDVQSREQVFDYIKPQAASWPVADFIVGNPPFIGKLKMRDDLGDGYVEALRRSYNEVPDSADFVMYWWHKAALSCKRPSSGAITRRFGFITTRAVKQTFNSRLVQAHVVDPKVPISIVFAIPDHPWVDTILAAKVRIAMTVCARGHRNGRLSEVISEEKSEKASEGWSVRFSEEQGTIRPNLRIGADILSARPLRANHRICSMGFATGARGFFLTESEAREVPDSERYLLKQILSAHEIAKVRKRRYVLDAWQIESERQLECEAPWSYLRLHSLVYPYRAQNNDPKLRHYWWKFRRSNETYRDLKLGLSRFIVAPETSKYRLFEFANEDTDVEHGAYGIGLDRADALAILSGVIHDTWALAQGGDLGATPRYNKTVCFDPFPFPDCAPAQTERLRDLGERLDAHRKARQAEHPKLTLTQMYNVLERLREIEATGSGEVLEGKEKTIYEQGQIGLLKDLHDQIDAAVADAYGWPADLSDEEILERLVQLNRERHLEEIGGKVRWLRPDYQNPSGESAASKTGELVYEEDEAVEGKHPWPKDLPQQMAMVRAVLSDLGTASVKDVQKLFRHSQTKTIRERLETLATLGQAERLEDDRYAA